MSDRTPPKTPEGLSAAGRRLWAAILADLPSELELEARELVVLEAAARQADVIASLERAVRRDGLMIRGASKQRRLNAAVAEIRQGRIAVARLLGELDLAGESVPQTAASQRARRAANVRWAEHARRAATRG